MCWVKFKVKSKDCQLSVTVKLSSNETVDEKELDRFSRVYLRGFLKPRLAKKNIMEYTGPMGISLQEHLKKPLTKRDFLLILEQVAVAVQKLQANYMGVYNLLMQLPYVYINETTKEVQFLYIPIVNGMQNTTLIDFIEMLACSAHVADENDPMFLSRFLYFFRMTKPFNIRNVEAFVAQEDASVVATIKKQNAGQSGFMTNKQQHYYDYYANQKAADDEATGLMADDEATGLMVDDEATGLMADDEATGLLTEEDEATGLLAAEEEATGLLVEEDDAATGLLVENHVRFPHLLRVLTGETVSVNKPVFRLGKERSYVDYFVTNNVAVSRSHADIITRGDKHFVKDLNSRNHTYINGQELPIQMEVEIRDGDQLRLGNEEFVFHV